jgi:hypothetical protein
MAAPMPYGMQPPPGQMYFPGGPGGAYGAGRGQMMGYPQQMPPQQRRFGPGQMTQGMPQGMPGYPQPYAQYPQQQPGAGRVSGALI